MENASKALLIAGGVLIAILIVSVLVVTLNIVNSNQRTREKALATEQLAEFNQKYEAYNKKALRGTDIITLKIWQNQKEMLLLLRLLMEPKKLT